MLTDFQDLRPFSDAYDISCNNLKEIMDYYCISNFYNKSDENPYKSLPVLTMANFIACAFIIQGADGSRWL